MPNEIDLGVFWKDKNSSAGIVGTQLTAQTMGAAMPSLVSAHDQFIVPISGQNNGFTLKGQTYIKLALPNGEDGFDYFVFGSEQDIVIPDARMKLDTGSAFDAGKDYYVYLVLDQTGNVPAADIVVSANATYPIGATADNSRKIGGFHTLCLGVGVLSGHPLSGFNIAEILPASFWDLRHRPICQPEGMVYIANQDFWSDIYLQSGTGANTKSVFCGTIVNLRSQADHAFDMLQVGKQLLSSDEFSWAAEGSNQRTAIQGAAQVATTGGHLDSTGRRMISNFGLEDCCGCYWQWLKEIFFQADQQSNGTNLGGWIDNDTYKSGNPESTITVSNNRVPGYTWIRRSSWTRGQDLGMNGLLAGGAWDAVVICGSWARNGNDSRLDCGADHAGRGAGRSK